MTNQNLSAGNCFEPRSPVNMVRVFGPLVSGLKGVNFFFLAIDAGNLVSSNSGCGLNSFLQVLI